MRWTGGTMGLQFVAFLIVRVVFVGDENVNDNTPPHNNNHISESEICTFTYALNLI